MASAALEPATGLVEDRARGFAGRWYRTPSFVAGLLILGTLIGLALAALSISRGKLFPPNDPTGLEVEMSQPPTQIVVAGAGLWRGEGMALVEAIK